jgi:MoxR-like ATPase/outer membrane murein-binding lipoprotein Lpp
MSINQFKADVLRLSGVDVAIAYLTLCCAPVASFSKLQQAEWLAQQLHGGVIVWDQVTRPVAYGTVPDVSIPPTPIPQRVNEEPISAIAKKVNVARGDIQTMSNDVTNLSATVRQTGMDVVNVRSDIQSVGAVAARAEQAALDGLSIANRTATAVTALQGQLGKIADTKLDPSVVSRAVADAVAAAFKPFEAAVAAAGAQTIVGDMVGAIVVDRQPALDVFGVDVLDSRGHTVMVDIWNDPTAPAIDPCFIWTESILKVLLLAQDDSANVWFGGEKGSGKSETAKQFAARTGRRYTRINFHKHTSAEDYVGATGLVAGATQFVKADFLNAFTAPGSVVLLDEVSNCSAGELAPLNGFLESNSAVSWGGSVHRRAPGVLCFAADNTLGSGDDSGRYTGTGTMNAALIDRFSLIIPFTFLPLSVEIMAVQNHTGCSKELATHIMGAITACRAKVASGDIVDAPSIRSVVAFVKALRRMDVRMAWDMTIASRQPSEGAAALEAIRIACVNESTIAANI